MVLSQQSSNKNSNFASDEFSFKENVPEAWPITPSPSRSKTNSTYKKIHLCTSCIDEGCSDMDSEGFECFGHLHLLKLNEYAPKDVNRDAHGNKCESAIDAAPVSSPVQKEAISKYSARQRYHRPRQIIDKATSASVASPINIPISNYSSQRSKTQCGSIYNRALAMHRMGRSLGWIKKHDAEELYPTCPGAHRRIVMVRRLKEIRPLRILCTILMIDEIRALNRPLLRGKLHLLLTYSSPLWMYYLILKDSLHLISSIISCISIFLCCFLSAFLHHRSPKCISKYKDMRNFDHCGIFLMITLSPTAIVAHETEGMEYYCLIGGQMFLCLVGCLWILKFGLMKAEPMTRVTLYIIAATGQLYNVWLVLRPHLIKIPSLKYHCLNLLWCVVGGLCFGLRLPTLWADVFSYHEVFHLCQTMTQISLLILIRNVIDRAVLVNATII